MIFRHNGDSLEDGNQNADSLESRPYHPTNPLDPHEHRLRMTDWVGMISLRLHSMSYTKNDSAGQGTKNRFSFVEELMGNLCNRTFKIKESGLIWVACDEPGFFGMGHVHILFSFDYLKTTGNKKKIPEMEYFQENGQFPLDLHESANFIWRELHKNRSTVDIEWRPMWNNDGLVNYFCECEDGMTDKPVHFGNYWKNHEGLNAA